jgi:hypothetical protein
MGREGYLQQWEEGTCSRGGWGLVPAAQGGEGERGMNSQMQKVDAATYTQESKLHRCMSMGLPDLRLHNRQTPDSTKCLLHAHRHPHAHDG